MDTKESNVIELSKIPEINDTLTEVLRQGAKQMLITAIHAEVAEFIKEHQHICDEQGRRQVVKNGYMPERNIQTGVGNIPVKVPRVRDNSQSDIKFSSSLLPR